MSDGGWFDYKPNSIPDEIVNGLEEAQEGLCGGYFTAHSYLASKVVNGVIHLMVCIHTMAIPEQPRKMVLIQLHQKPDNSFSIINSETIDLNVRLDN